MRGRIYWKNQRLLKQEKGVGMFSVSATIKVERADEPATGVEEVMVVRDRRASVSALSRYLPSTTVLEWSFQSTLIKVNGISFVPG